MSEGKGYLAFKKQGEAIKKRAALKQAALEKKEAKIKATDRGERLRSVKPSIAKKQQKLPKQDTETPEDIANDYF